MHNIVVVYCFICCSIVNCHSQNSYLLRTHSNLIGKYGGTFIQYYVLRKFFTATLTQAQATSMASDSCTLAIEPNYIVRARGTSVNTDHQGQASSTRRYLGIPEFNKMDDNPPSWGLERISTRGKKNGKYIWVSEGFGTDVCKFPLCRVSLCTSFYHYLIQLHSYSYTDIFDTGVYPSHIDWRGRNEDFDVPGDSRLQEPYICTGEIEANWENNNHGTFIASIVAGQTMGLARSSNIHPIQVLDANGEGSITSLLCGMEKLVRDGIDYYSANAPKKIRAVVNLSLGVDGRSEILDEAVGVLADIGYVVVIGAGDNSGISKTIHLCTCFCSISNVIFSFSFSFVYLQAMHAIIALNTTKQLQLVPFQTMLLLATQQAKVAIPRHLHPTMGLASIYGRPAKRLQVLRMKESSTEQS